MAVKHQFYYAGRFTPDGFAGDMIMTRHAFSQKMATKTLESRTSLFFSESAVVNMYSSFPVMQKVGNVDIFVML